MSEVNDNIEEEVVDTPIQNEENDTETPTKNQSETQTETNTEDEGGSSSETEYHNEDIDPDNPIEVDDSGDSPEEIVDVIHKIDITGNINYIQHIIPGEYLPTYKKLLYALSKIGKQIMDDCAYSCKQGGHNIFVCWQLFQSAIAAYNIGETKKADLFIKYINSQLPKSIRLEQVELDVIDHKYPNVSYYVNANGSTVFTLQAIYEGKVYQRTITLPIDGYVPPVKAKAIYEIFTWEAIQTYLSEKSYEQIFDITKEELTERPTSIVLENGSHTVSGDVIYIYVPSDIRFSVTDLLQNAFEFVEGETKHTTDDGVYYLLTDVSDVYLNVG